MGEKAAGEQFGSRWGLIVTSMGAAVGTGNIWRFPKEVAANGGGAFLIPWIIFLFAWSIPLLIAEFSIGKKARLGTGGAFKHFLGKRYTWMGIWMLVVTTIIGFYYAIVMGWTMYYGMIGFLSLFNAGPLAGGNVDTQAVWDTFHNNPLLVIFFQVLALALSGGFLMIGVSKGLETVNKILMPALIVLLAAAAIIALTRPNAAAGLKFMFAVQPDKLWEAETWIRGLAQSAWSCSAGMGMAITYAVYMKKEEDTSLNALITGLGNNSISLIAGIAVFCTVFAGAANPHAVIASDSTGLTFVHLTNLFITGFPPFIGAMMAFAFFTAMAFAALTSMMSGMENAQRNLADHGLTRKKAVMLVTGVSFFAGLPAAIWPWALHNMDTVWGLGLMISGLFVAFAVWYYGVTAYRKWQGENGLHGFNFIDFLEHGVPAFREDLINHEYADIHIPKAWDFVLWIVFPIGFTVLLGWFTIQSIVLDPNWWKFWAFNKTPISNTWIQWIGVMGLLILLNKKISSIETRRNIVAGEEDLDQDPTAEVEEAMVVEEVEMTGPQVVVTPPRT